MRGRELFIEVYITVGSWVVIGSHSYVFEFNILWYNSDNKTTVSK